VRLLKDIALAARTAKVTLLLIGHRIDLPQELASFSARFALRIPEATERRASRRCLTEYREDTADRWPSPTALELLVQNLSGLTHADTERLARNAIRDDGAVAGDDVPAVMQAKYQLLNRGGVLSFEYETTRLDELAGFRRLKTWLQHRRAAFGDSRPAGLDAPKGMLMAFRAAARASPLKQPPAPSAYHCCASTLALSTTSTTAKRNVTCGNR
jgi:hypothetical protein